MTTSALNAPFAGQVAIVTGATSDIGRAIATALSAQGAHTVLIGRNAKALEDIAASLRAGKRQSLVSACDVTRGEEVQKTVAEAAAAFDDRIDILVNVAGGTGSLGVPLWEVSERDFTNIVTLNLTTAFLTMAAVLPKMIARRCGRIVNIGGTYGLRGRAGRAAYSAAKWGLRGLTKSAALEAGPHNITVNCVCPGMVAGAQFEKAAQEMANRKSLSLAEAKANIASGYALHRVSTPDDIAAMVVFLSGEGGRQITGQDLVVDGGQPI